jgi:small-conductance mechanosensitive channel/CRP-like cAMP-binding protein
VRLNVIVGLVFLLASLGARRATINRHIRGRLLLSAWLFAAYTLAGVGVDWIPLNPETRQQLLALNPAVLAFGIVNFVVTLTINPWRADRVPDRFPNIVQDTLVIALFSIVATLILRDRVMTTTAVGAVVIGLALQDTLGNLFAGLAIQIEKPFRVGDWVMVGSQDGQVSEITWRATKMRTKAGNFVVVPNSVLAKDTITNYSEPTRSVLLHVEVGASYDVPPNRVKSVVRQALMDVREISSDPPIDVLLVEFAASSINYRVRFWISDFAADERVKDRVRTLIYYALRREGITIPYPIQIEMSAEQGGLAPGASGVDQKAMSAVPMFASLTDDDRAGLMQIARPVLFSSGEAIVRQGHPGRSLFVITHGEARVTLAGAEGDLARLHAGDVFGEMSLLTGEPRNATVVAETDCELLEIDADGFRQHVLGNPTVLERFMQATAARREELERHRETQTQVAKPADSAQTLLARVRQYLRL